MYINGSGSHKEWESNIQISVNDKTIKLPEVRHINIYSQSNMTFSALQRAFRLQFPCREKISADLHVSQLLRGNTRALSGHSAQYNTCRKIKRGEEIKNTDWLHFNRWLLCHQQAAPCMVGKALLFCVLRNFKMWKNFITQMRNFLSPFPPFLVQCQCLWDLHGCRQDTTVSNNNNKATDKPIFLAITLSL